jgi:hypothetical protein
MAFTQTNKVYIGSFVKARIRIRSQTSGSVSDIQPKRSRSATLLHSNEIVSMGKAHRQISLPIANWQLAIIGVRVRQFHYEIIRFFPGFSSTIIALCTVRKDFQISVYTTIGAGACYTTRKLSPIVKIFNEIFANSVLFLPSP